MSVRMYVNEEVCNRARQFLYECEYVCTCVCERGTV
jgi:hypothetical protein